MNNLLCVYHANCDDGFGAAWAVRHAFLDKLNPLSSMDGVEFYAATHGGRVPDVHGRFVVFVDFVYPHATMERLIAEAEHVVVLDHHKSSMQDIGDWASKNNDYVIESWGSARTIMESKKARFIFDMDRSGAMMAWDHYHPNEMAPRFIQYIQDRDLWQNKEHGIREFTAALRSWPMNFDTWDRLFGFNPLPQPEVGLPIEESIRSAQSMMVFGLVGEGTPIARYKNQLVESAVKNSFWVEIQVPADTMMPGAQSGFLHPDGKYRHVIKIRGANVMPAICSEVGEELALRYGGMGMTWVEGVKLWNYQLRSRKVGDQPAPDVSKIAMAMGGGGHHQASGFKTEHAVHFKAPDEREDD